MLARELRPREGSGGRYEGGNLMAYTVEGRKGDTEEEDAGALNLAHGWIQQSQVEKVTGKIINIGFILTIDTGSLHFW
jgi:hypothetical protein